MVAPAITATIVPIGYEERKEGRERKKGEIINKNTPFNHEHPPIF